MRLDLVYAISSLWGAPAGPQVCPASVYTAPRAVGEVTWSPMRVESAEVTAFVDVSVVPMDTERVLAHQTVLVQGRRITAMGPSGEILVPAGAVRIDGRGKYLIPGLGDMHVHPTLRDIGGETLDEIKATLVPHIADGVTTIRYLNPVSDQESMLMRAESLGVHVYILGLAVSSRGTVRGYMNGMEELKRPDRVAAYVAATKAAGYDLVRMHPSAVYARDTLPVVDSLLAAARQLDLPLVTHAHEASFTETLALGAYGGSTDHLRSFWIALGLSSEYHLHDSLRQHEVEGALSKISTFAAAAQRAGVWITPTLYCLESKYVPTRAKVTILRGIVKGLQDAGAGLLLAGDDGKGVHDELAAMVRAGLTPYQALLTGTRNVAQYLGILDSNGTVAIGKRADLVLLNGNPLEDIRHTREPAGVMLHGRWLDRAELDQRLITLTVKRAGRPLSWLRLGTLNGGIVPSPYRGRHGPPPHLQEAYEKAQEQRAKFTEHIEQFEIIGDSLAVVKSLGSKGKSRYQRLLERQAAEFEAMRALLPPERHVIFDPVVRVWLREQARKGYRVTISGVAPIP